MLLHLLVALFSVQEMLGIRQLQTDFSSENWTSCEEFLNETTLDPLRLIDVDWKIFYFWTYDFEESFHIKFSIPTRGLIEGFKRELDDELFPPVNWTQADLFMETSIDLSGLFIRTDNPGVYRLIPSLSFQYTSTPLVLFGLKLVNGYLGLMNCKYRLCYALASVERMPDSINIEEAASSLNFFNPLGRSYLVKDNDQVSRPPLVELDDADDDEQREIDSEINNLRII